MGYIKHHAIVVTSFDQQLISEVHQKATEIFGTTCSPVIDSKTNRYISFFIGPDGSKEGWEESNQGDENRAKFIQYIQSKAYGDGSNSVSYAELFYGEDNGYCEIVNHN